MSDKVRSVTAFTTAWNRARAAVTAREGFRHHRGTDLMSLRLTLKFVSDKATSRSDHPRHVLCCSPAKTGGPRCFVHLVKDITSADRVSRKTLSRMDGSDPRRALRRDDIHRVNTGLLRAITGVIVVAAAPIWKDASPADDAGRCERGAHPWLVSCSRSDVQSAERRQPASSGCEVADSDCEPGEFDRIVDRPAKFAALAPGRDETDGGRMDSPRADDTSARGNREGACPAVELRSCARRCQRPSAQRVAPRRYSLSRGGSRLATTGNWPVKPLALLRDGRHARPHGEPAHHQRRDGAAPGTTHR
jgi:hypothetical protein